MASNSRRVIPSEELSGFQRWQFGSLLDGLAAQPAPVAESVPDAPESPAELLGVDEGMQPTAFIDEESGGVPDDVSPELSDEPALPYPTAEEIEAIQRQAHEEGYQAGLQTGRQQAEVEQRRLQQLADEYGEWLQQAEAALAEEVLDLALVVARQVLRDAYAADRKILLPGIREALAALPAARAPARLHLHPDDCELLQGDLKLELTDDVWRLIPDPALAPGGVRIETPASSLDASLVARWQSQLSVLRRNQREDLQLELSGLPEDGLASDDQGD
ncbi:FliH/SctL family protein [Chitinilyticum piscinae]|uniref:Flagellar assembly protein FliH n=1 Tax=Chitinilyticum piscinae TaxID=2866724 RepID=A0A8J7FYQ9_9NEIS|nr:FliH/SctL family protein [Chitinilyticum piscinae]MBE9608810.1 hypothetical protein [Chitinilyticum piscinae]